MKKLRKIILCFSLVTMAFLSFFLFQTSKVSSENSDPDVFLANVDPDKIDELKNDGYKLDEVKLKSNPNLYKVERTDEVGTFDYLKDEILSDKIKNKQKRRKYEAATNDTYYSQQWNIPKIEADDAWTSGVYGSSDVTVAVLDTGMGIGLTASTPIHQDFTGRVWIKTAEALDGLDNDGNGKIDDRYGWDFVGTDNNPAPNNGGGSKFSHGTQVAGVIAANSNNNQGVAGIDWNAKIMPLRVMDNNGSGWTDDIAAGIEYAADNGADVINMSLGYANSYGPDFVLETAISYAYNRTPKGVVLVAASGNDGAGVNYPAASENVIAVGATDSLDRRIDPALGYGWGSSYGSQLDIMAPGLNIPTTHVTWNGSAYTVNEYAYSNGTSLSSPHVAALAALIISRDDTLTNAGVDQRIKQFADKPSDMGGQNFTNYFGYGRMNVKNSIPIGLNLTTSLTLSNNTPAIGETVTATYTIKNKGTNQITLDYLGIGNRLNGYTNRDFPWLTNITLEPSGQAGDSYDVSLQKTFAEVGSYQAWAAYSYEGIFYNAEPDTNQTVSKSFLTHAPDIKATSVIAANPTIPLAGQSATYTVTVQNNEANPISFAHLGLANRRVGDYGNYDIGWNPAALSGSLPTGSTQLSFQKTLTLTGSYRTWLTIHVGNYWYEVWDNLNPSHLNFSVGGIDSAVTVTTALTLSNNSPAIGEVVTATYTLRNNTSQAVTLSYVGVGNRLNTYTNKDFGWTQNITIQPSDTYNVVATKTFTDVGSYYAWAAYAVGGNFYNARPETTQAVSKSFTTRVPNIKATTVITKNPATVNSGQSVTYEVTVSNNESVAIAFSHLGIAARNTNTWANSDIGWQSAGSLSPGTTVLSFSKTINQAGPYKAWATMHIGNSWFEIWDNLNPSHIYFNVN